LEAPHASIGEASGSQKKITRCAIYTRVSTDRQAEVEFNSCEAQEDRIRSFIASQEGFEVAHVYSDPGFTGANMNRPALRQMVNDIRAGQIDLVFTYKIDRLTRAPRDFYQLIEFFETHQVSFISVTERFDTSTPAGRLLRNIMLTFAQFERELASERVKDKVIQRVNRGLYHGGHPPFGYKAENGGLVLDPPRDGIVKMIFETYIKTRSFRAIMRVLKEKNVVSRRGNPFVDSAIWNMVKNPVYTGKISHKGKLHPGKHPPIISEELFNHVQKLMTESPRLQMENHSHLPFAGIIKCGECGSTMCVAYSSKLNKNGHKYYYYRCSKVGHEGKDACGTRQIGAERLHNTVYGNLLRLSFDPEYLRNLVFSLKNQTSHPRANCVEPLHPFADLTPEKLQKELKAFVKACARKPGIEKALSVRKWIESVRYTKKTIGVDFVLVGSETEKQEATTTERGDVPRRSIDGEDPMEGDSTPSARSAENGENLIPSDVRCRAGGTIRNEGNSVARIQKDSPRLDTSDSFQPGGVSKMAEGEGFEPSRILRPYTISSRADSAALAPFLRSCRSESFKLLDDILLINVAGGGEGVF
jgi:site-specific DNA recombinase